MPLKMAHHLAINSRRKNCCFPLEYLRGTEKSSSRSSPTERLRIG